MYFNPRSREGSDNIRQQKIKEEQEFQSTLPRRERHARSLIPCLHHLISIHAPAKGATGQQRLSAPETCISIHAPAKGATQLEAYSNADEAISIHAPAKGATVLILPFAHNLLYFNPRSREGSDVPAPVFANSSRKFQSTLPRRERQKQRGNRDSDIRNFNPRSREGSDRFLQK